MTQIKSKNEDTTMKLKTKIEEETLRYVVFECEIREYPFRQNITSLIMSNTKRIQIGES